MTTITHRQKGIDIQQGGSFHNILMSNNASIPKAGEKATILFYTDRRVVEVVEVSEDKNSVKLNDGRVLVFRKGSWYHKYQTIEFVKDFSKWIDNNYSEWIEMRSVFFDENNKIKIVEGKTKLVTKYDKVHIVFGLDDEYYDPSF